MIKYILILLLSIFFSKTAFAETALPPFDISDMYHYRTYDGMGSERVYSIVEGLDHAIWMGTRAGVERLNGRKIKHYNLSDSQQTDNFAGRVIKLFRTATPPDKTRATTGNSLRAGIGAFDNSGRIYYFNDHTDRFEIFQRLSDRIPANILLNDVVQLEDGSLLLGLNIGLYRLKNNRLARLCPDMEVNAITIYGHTAYLATSDGIAQLRLGQKPELTRALRGTNVQSIFIDPATGNLFAGTFDAGLWRYNFATRRSEHLCPDQKPLQNPIRGISALDHTRIAIGIDGSGVYIYDSKHNTLRKLVDTDDTNRFYLNGNGVYALMPDSYGNLWTGSYTGGAAVMLFRPSAVNSITHEAGNPQSVRHNNINAISENTDGTIWYATDSGISIHSPADGHWRHSSNNSVTVTIESMTDGRMVAGTYGNGLLELDAAGNVTRSLTRANGKVTSNSIFNIKRSRAGEYWAATLDGGVMRLDASLRLIHTYPVEVAFSITETPDGKIGVATANGFYIIDPKTDALTHYTSANQTNNHNISCYITSLLFNKDGTVWCSTEGGGVFLYDIARRRVQKIFKTAQGLPANDVYSMQRDARGRMIVSTSHGLALYNGLGFKSLNYMRRLAKEYNKSASTLLSNGDMIFGSVHGAEHLIPSKITNADYKAAVNIRGIETVVERSHDKTSPYDTHDAVKFHSIQDGGVKLNYADRTFSVYFEAINLPYQDDITFKYMLEGYDDTWCLPTQHNVADYKNVPPGRYTLRVRSLRNSDGEILDEASVKISIADPWWGSWWAWCVYLSACAVIIVIVYRAYRFKTQKQHDDDKIRFFVNTAHNIRTPVSLVMAPITDLRHENSLSDKARELVDTALTNIGKLSNITNQLLEFERFDSEKKQIDLRPVEISSLLRIETECFRDAMQRKNITLGTEGLSNEAYVTADTYLLEILFDNLLSNAYKYTNSGGNVNVSLHVEPKRVQIVVQDNGIGIPVGERRHIMKKVYRARNARETNNIGTGFGLLQVRRIVEMLSGKIRMLSAEGKGTSFIITLKRIHPWTDATQNGVVERKTTSAFIDTDTFASSGRDKNCTDKECTDREYPPIDTDHSILIVEDNDDLRHYLRDTFSEKYHVTTVSDASKALDYLQNHYPDLILSDVMMPGMQGDELCRQIKSNSSTAGIPVILLTAKADHDSVIGGLGCGADDYIAKPFNSDILRIKVSGMIANRDRLRQYLLSGAISGERSATTISGDESEKKDAEVSSVTADRNPDTAELGDLAVGNEIGTPSDREFVERATSIVRGHMADYDFDIDRLCREMAMSRTLLFGRLKSLTGKAPQDFIRLLRMETAAELLRQGLSVTEVAERTGFANVKYFSTVFKKHFGTQPSKFQQSLNP